MKSKIKYWYHITYQECVLCGKERIYKERQYIEKPEDINKRYEYVQIACDWHFM